MQTETSPKAGERTQIMLGVPSEPIQRRARHTPGPWRLQELHDGEGYRAAISRLGTGWWIAKITNGGQSGEQEEGRANARLIAAAPKMAALLRKIYDSPSSGEMEAWMIRDIQDCLTEAGLTK